MEDNRPPLFLRETGKEPPASSSETPVTQEYVGGAKVEMKLYGAGGKEVNIVHHATALCAPSHDKVTTMNFFLHLRQEWDTIVKAPFACVLCLVFGFAGGSWYYAEQVATLSSQVAFWKDKATAGATPTPVGQTPAASAASAANTSAHFIINAEGASFYSSPDDPKLLTGIVLDVQLRNSGMASKATGWSLTVTPKGGTVAAAQYEKTIPKALTFGDPPQILRASEGLADKVLKKSLQSGQVASGRLLFYVRLPLASVQDPATKLTLSVQDIAGNMYSTAPMVVGDWLHPRSDSGN